MGMRGSPTGEIFLDDVRIPADQLLGGGVRERGHVKSSLASERVGLAVMSYAIAERCYEIARDYAGREPVLVASLKASLVFIADLSRAIPILHALDFVELAGYGSAVMGGHQQIRVLKDLDLDVRGRDVLIVEDVVDTGLTLNYLVRTFGLRGPASVAAVTLLDRPYRRLVDDLPVRYVGFPVPDELYVGYGFDLEERYRELPDLHLLNLS
jgi:hypoxanthine phosphoribosyltransferase